MFERDFAPLMVETERVHVGALDTYISYLRSTRNKLHRQYGHTLGYSSIGISTIAQVIGEADVDQMVRDYRDPMSRYLFGVMPKAHAVEGIFDPVMKGPMKRGSFIRNSGCKEYLFPVEPKVPMTSYPIFGDWDDWKDFRAFRLIDVDVNELTYFSYMDRLNFLRGDPQYAVFTLDVKGLLLQRIAYLKSVGEDDPLSIDQWIHQYVVFPCLTDDVTLQWLLGVYDALFTVRVRSERVGYQDRWNDGSNTYVGVQLENIKVALSTILDQSNRDSVTIPKVLSSLLLVDHGSLPEYYRFMLSEVTFPPLRQYKWGEFLRDRRVMRIALKAAINDPRSLLAHTLSVQLKQDLSLMKMAGITSAIRDSGTRKIVDDQIGSFWDLSVGLTALVG